MRILLAQDSRGASSSPQPRAGDPRGVASTSLTVKWEHINLTETTLASRRRPAKSEVATTSDHLCNAIKIGCAARSQALHSMRESASWFPCGLRRLLCLCALGSCSGGFLFWQRLLCALILSVVRWLLRLSWLRVLQLLPELLRLWVGRLLSALVAASVLRRVLWRVARTQVGRRTRMAWRRMAPPSLTWSLGHDAPPPSRQVPRGAFERLSMVDTAVGGSGISFFVCGVDFLQVNCLSELATGSVWLLALTGQWRYSLPQGQADGNNEDCRTNSLVGARTE
jgi:hypothetical protein